MRTHPTEAIQSELDARKADCITILQTTTGCSIEQAEEIIKQTLKVPYRIIRNQQVEIDRLRRMKGQ